jgi:hypothetical protein
VPSSMDWWMSEYLSVQECFVFATATLVTRAVLTVFNDQGIDLDSGMNKY